MGMTHVELLARMALKRILYISQEIFPYVEQSEIAKVSRELPEYMQHYDKNEVRLFMPRYGTINERRNQLHEVQRLSGINLTIDNRDHPLIVKVASIPSARMQVYFLHNDDFFKRKTGLEVSAKGPNDNDERSLFFVQGVFETIKKLRWEPGFIHCHGAFTALAMLYLRKVYNQDEALNTAKLVVSVYNEEQAVEIPTDLFAKLKSDGIAEEDYAVMEGKTDYEALMKLAISHADAVVQGSEVISPSLAEFIAKSGKPFLAYPGAEHPAEVYNNFYEQL